MTKGVFNWTYKDVVAVLREHKFHLNYIDSSHHYYTRLVSGRLYQVSVPFHGSKVFKPKTFKSIIAQSGLTRGQWGL